MCDLRNLICTGEAQPRITVEFTRPPDVDNPRGHYLYVLLRPANTKVSVGLFDTIEFSLFAPPMPVSLLNDFVERTETKDVVGIGFRQESFGVHPFEPSVAPRGNRKASLTHAETVSALRIDVKLRRDFGLTQRQIETNAVLDR